MKRSEFKSLVKECLVEILRDNMELFTESSPTPKGRATKKAVRSKGSKKKMKQTLMTLLEDHQQLPQARPQMRPMPQNRQQQPQGSASDLQSLILSAAATMQQQNSMGEMNSRSIESGPVYQSPVMQQMPQQMDSDPGYSAYGNVPIPHSHMSNGGVGVPIPHTSPSYGPDVDGESRWSKVAFFDQQ